MAVTVGGAAESYVYDDGDKLQSVSVGGTAVKTYSYDAAGRTTSVVSSSGTTTLSYDAEGRAISISGPGVSQTNSCNGLDTRVSSVTNSVTNTFLRDGAYVTDPVVKDSNATYTPGISERRFGTTKHLSHNLKSVDSQVTTGQSVAASRVYDAFGNVTSSTGTFVGPFGYGGGFGCQEEATGLKLLGHRMHDSSTVRFMTRDPIKDGRNWYVYCENDPVNFNDESGYSKGGNQNHGDSQYGNWSKKEIVNRLKELRKGKLTPEEKVERQKLQKQQKINKDRNKDKRNNFDWGLARDVGTVVGAAVITGCIIGIIILTLPVSAPAAVVAGGASAAAVDVGVTIRGGATQRGKPGML